MFVFNTDGNGRPIPGAPSPNRLYDELTADIVQICDVCKAMKDNEGLNNDYWRSLHKSWLDYEKRRRDDIDKQTGRKDYFSGA